ncbi:adenylate/guanylate cyclase domain-containing protein [Candidatus Methylobacter oryzae]|uniref:HAMP domain-containing protein n=1 Tax=Candidatus Methylobacter oryzae TaxID=2497749 RepID=A0ABY3CE87_9GAMM|nr:adenylate/guanylate cyclase domain-containing protein [Candidatus Methylobacter oryzae]TRX00879.1 HAMP domain-containing protein [Candidatus Methylobacter oryzae]
MNLNKKIFITFFISVTGLLCTTLYLIDTQAEQHEIKRIASDLDAAQAQFQHDLEIEQKQIQTLTHVITTDQKFRSFLAQIKDNFYPFVEEIGKDTHANFVFMLDAEPTIRAVYSLNDQGEPPLADNFAEFNIQHNLDTAQIVSTIVSVDEGLYSSHIIPLKENLNDDYAVGLIVVCDPINDAWLARLLAKNNALQAVFFNGSHVAAKNTSPDLAAGILNNHQNNGLFNWHDERYIAKRVLFETNNQQAGYILSANLDQALRPFKQLQRQVAMIGGGILLAGALLFMLISQRITRPLRLITTGTLEIKHGNYQHRIGYQNSDEVGQLAAAFNVMANDLQEKELIRSTFNKYVDPVIVSELLSQPDKLRLGGERKEQTVLFSDIAGFTNFSEKLPAEELIRILNEYLSAMTLEISRQNGILDKFIGDAIMAFWSPELCHQNHASHACQTALAMQRKLNDLRPVWLANGAPEINIRIGIATGDMIVGNIGSEQARSYTCIGDKVNYSSRLESLNKYYGTQIMIDRQTASGLSGFVVRELDTVRVKGRESGESIYELVATADDIDSAALEKIARYRQALALYRNADFAEAAEIFATLNADAPSNAMLKRCRYLQQNKPESWDGIHSMLDK